jgi:AbiU2
MTALLSHRRPAETVRQIAELALGDAVEITLLIALIERQNAGEINGQLNKDGAGRAAVVFRNALIARLVTLIARAYAIPKHGDLHLRVAAVLLEDNATRQVFGSGNGAEKLAAFDAHWAKCRGDHRLPAIKTFRDKYTVHLGEPKDIQEATYRDLFEFGAKTAAAMELLALATGVAVNPISTEPDLVSSPEAFWAPWIGKQIN